MKLYFITFLKNRCVSFFFFQIDKILRIPVMKCAVRNFRIKPRFFDRAEYPSQKKKANMIFLKLELLNASSSEIPDSNGVEIHFLFDRSSLLFVNFYLANPHRILRGIYGLFDTRIRNRNRNVKTDPLTSLDSIRNH